MASKRRQAIKKRTIPTKEQQSIKLYNETLKQVRKTNARLDSLQRRNKKGGTWAIKKLRNRLDSDILKAWTKNGKIKIPKNITNTKLKQIQTATKQFLDSKTSTNKGIKSIREQTK